MPIYGYRCEECGHQLEVFQSMSDAPLRECPKCGGVLRKVLYPVGVQFKGSGFYTTDYRNGRSSDKAETKSADGSSDKSSDKSGEKSAASSSEKKAETSAAKDKD